MTLEPEPTFEDVAARLARAYDKWKKAESEVEDLKAQLRVLVNDADGLRRDRSSLYLDLPAQGKSVGVSDAGLTQSVNPQRFRDRIADDELYLRLVTVTKVTLNLPEWLLAIEEERVTEDDLLAAIDEKPTTPRVTVNELKRSV